MLFNPEDTTQIVTNSDHQVIFYQWVRILFIREVSKLQCRPCLVYAGQVGLGVGSWTSNLTNAGSIPAEFD